MKKDEVCALIRKLGILPAVRVSSGDDAHFVVEAITQGGIPIVEITMTVPGAVELISHLIRHHPGVTVGAGTVLDVDTARRCVDAGASFLTSPGFDLEIVQFAAKKDLTVLPGAWTATEVMVAWKAGSDFVKVFPCVQSGGDRYIQALHTSLPQIPLIAAGGVNQQNAASFILSGATALGIGRDLVPAEAIERRESRRIQELAHRFRGFVDEARRRMNESQEKSAARRKFKETDECKK
jgi:2-dehydro-3-deoxyphosphogluconate aldolase/(4S)-4-hydroxy-2-oxoglutarate aldolase